MTLSQLHPSNQEFDMSTSRSQQEAYEQGQSDGSKGDYNPPGGFVDVISRPMRDCDDSTRDKAYQDGHKNGEDNPKK